MTPNRQKNELAGGRDCISQFGETGPASKTLNRVTRSPRTRKVRTWHRIDRERTTTRIYDKNTLRDTSILFAARSGLIVRRLNGLPHRIQALQRRQHAFNLVLVSLKGRFTHPVVKGATSSLEEERWSIFSYGRVNSLAYLEGIQEAEEGPTIMLVHTVCDLA